MSTYHHGSGLSYSQYLQAKSFVSDVTGATNALNLSVTKQTRELVASQQALAKENIHAMKAGFGKVVEATEAGFEQLSWEIRDVGQGISELNATFNWGLGEMVTKLTQMNSAVSQLVRLATTPIQTEATEYFQNAQDAFRQGLYPEALEEAQKAISKHRLEWRYYSFAGRLCLGSVSGGLELLDLTKAEEYYLLAARYAKADSPSEAARSYLAASWAAYCQKKLGPALVHVEEALKLDRSLPEALFQAAKIRMALSEPDNALPLLGAAIELDKGYAMKAAADGDFQRHEPDLRQFLESLREEKTNLIRSEMEAALAKYQNWFSRSAAAAKEPLVIEIRSFLNAPPMPFWDLLFAAEDLRKLVDQLDQRASEIRFVHRHEGGGPELDFEEKTRSAPVPQFKTVRKRGKTEALVIHDATGAEFLRIDLETVAPGKFTTQGEVLIEGEYFESPDAVRRITSPFLLSTTPITMAQFQAILGGSPSSVQDRSGCAVNVTWNEAVRFCNTISQETGLEEAYILSSQDVIWRGFRSEGYRLLTEAEWKYLKKCGRTSPVGEWVFDWWTTKRWRVPEENPVIPDGSSRDAEILKEQGKQPDSIPRVICGVTRAMGEPTTKHPDVGFRIARTISL
jgi:tetratricopeptide (TPR) repeat protein